MNRLIAAALRYRVLIVIALILFLGAGLVAFSKLNIEAYPDPVPPLVDIVTQSSGMSAEEIERYVTIPIEIQLAGMPHVSAIRTISLFGLSDVKVQFTYDFTYQQAEQWVINRLSALSPLPNGVQPQISPTSPIGEIYRYRLRGPPGYLAMDLKTIQDWILQRRLKAVPGVIDVNGWGGKTKTFDAIIDQNSLSRYGITLPQVLQALNNGNVNVGGQTITMGAQAAVVRGIGLIHSMEDIRNTLIAANNGAPVYLRDVATIAIGHLPRLGIAGQDDDNEVVEGIILMRRGEQSLPTLRRVEAEIENDNTSGILPPGVHLEKIYDRTDLINITTHTVLHNMVTGVALIFVVQWLFLGNLRSALIVATTIPFALFFAIMIMLAMGESANLLSVGAIDFGLIVDATVIMVETIFRHLVEAEHAPATVGRDPHLLVVEKAATEVNRAIFFSVAIIIAGFVPLFTLAGVEGHIFGPMARTYAYAIGGGLLATFTVSPALSALLLTQNLSEIETFAVRRIRRLYGPVLDLVLRHQFITLAGAVLLCAGAVVAAQALGLEFLPKLEEGNFWIRATMPPSISLEEGNRYVNDMRKVIRGFPEMVTVISQNGRPDDGTDATGFFNAEFFVPLKPAKDWPKGIDKAALTQQLNDALVAKFPGVEFNFSQNIQDNVEEAASGVKGENSVKLFGKDLETLEKTAARIKEIMKTIPGITDLAVLNSLGQPTVKIDVDRVRAARYGLSPGDVNTTVQTAIGGQPAGNLYEDGSDRNFPIMVRLAPEYRSSLEAIRHLTIGALAPDGTTVVPVPLADVATVKLVSGAAFIYREQQERYIPIKFSVRGRDLGSAVSAAQDKIAETLKLPVGYRLEWVGEFGEMQEALGRLGVVVPIGLILICLLLFLNFESVVDALLAASVMPMALIGGVLALVVTGTPFSVSAAIGFIALFGIAAMDGIIVLTSFNNQLRRGYPRMVALRRACEMQMRPVVMTCIAACVGLLPAAVSTGIGSQVQKPLALVVVGGMLLAPVLILVVLPVLIGQFSRRKEAVPEETSSSSAVGPPS